jgi:hypothetical protein
VKRIDPKLPKNKNYMLVVKARTLEAKTKALKAKITALKAKARALKTKAKGMTFCPRESSRPRPVLEHYNTGSKSSHLTTACNY